MRGDMWGTHLNGASVQLFGVWLISYNCHTYSTPVISNSTAIILTFSVVIAYFVAMVTECAICIRTDPFDFVGWCILGLYRHANSKRKLEKRATITSVNAVYIGADRASMTKQSCFTRCKYIWNKDTVLPIGTLWIQVIYSNIFVLLTSLALSHWCGVCGVCFGDISKIGWYQTTPI